MSGETFAKNNLDFLIQRDHEIRKCFNNSHSYEEKRVKCQRFSTIIRLVA